MEGFAVGSIEYSHDEIRDFVFDSVVDGYCSKCDDIVMNVEPDASGYDCPHGEHVGTVDSVLVKLGLI